MSGHKIIDGLKEALAHARGEETGARETVVNLPFSRVPTCACDRGVGDPPTKLQRMECRMRGGPCREPT